MFTQSEATILMEFLDRAPIQGHKERQAMNVLTTKIANTVISDTPPSIPAIEPKNKVVKKKVVKKAGAKK